MKRFLLSITIAFGLFSSCSKNDNQLPNFHYDYFPLEQGRYVVYEAMDITHDIQALVERDTNKYFLKTVIGDSILDESGNWAYKFLRYKKTEFDNEWILADVWTTRLVEQRLELVDENQRNVKLVFPTNKNKVWDINAYNTNDRQLARYNADFIHTSRNISGENLDSTVQVEIQDFFSLVDHRRKYEIFAKGIGMVWLHYKDNRIANFDTLDIQFGRESHYKMIEFGKE